VKYLSWLKLPDNPPPQHYQAGLTLQRLAHDLYGLDATPINARCYQFNQPNAQWNFEVLEKVQPQFLMHIVNCCFVMKVTPSSPGKSRIRIMHSGLWRRTGLRWKIIDGNAHLLQPVILRLQADQPLCQALMALDFQRVELIQSDQGWHVEAEPYAASEVVLRFPAMRRYIHLDYSQAQYLLNTLARLQGKLRPY